MKIIDNQGRIFGKWNIIDFLVVLFCLCLMPIFFFAHNIMIKLKSPPPPPIIVFDRAEYKKDQAAIKERMATEKAKCRKELAKKIAEHQAELSEREAEIARFKREIAKRDKVKDEFLREFKGARKYFDGKAR